MKMTYDELRTLWTDFFKEKGHAAIASASVLPENDATVLFTTAGMQPLVPYLMGEKHPAGKRLTDIQKCIRTNDIAEVGDHCHLTFFEMLGNWSLGDYFKKETIAWSYEFLTTRLGFKKEQLAVTCFCGDDKVAKDTEAADYWKEQGLDENQIFFLSDNWWGLADGGPCGPDTEMFIDNGQAPCGPDCSPACHCGKYTEVWNDVFMQYLKNKDGSLSDLSQKNVDTGMGLERILAFMNGIGDVFTTELFEAARLKLEELSGKKYEDNLVPFRKILDHTRTAVFILGDDKAVVPSNTDQGYVLRRLIRIAIRNLKKLGVNEGVLPQIAACYVDKFKKYYPELERNSAFIMSELEKEEQLFNRTIIAGLREMDKVVAKVQDGMIDGKTAFHLYDTYGFPLEFTQEIAAEHNINVDVAGFNACYEAHQELSRKGAEQKFKGGLADHSEKSAHYHTATHIMHAVLRGMFGDTVAQKGSNITPERMRFDFSFDRKLTPEEVKEVETKVNAVIEQRIPVECAEKTLEEAQAEGAIGLFAHKYDAEKVKVYTIAGVSKEVCGGPHATNTGDLGHFRILKEESSSAGVRRIKAVLE